MDSFYTELKEHDLFRISGSDRTKFLQGQLTCDVEKLHQKEVCPGAACNVKGRVYASFYLYNLEDCFYMSANQGVGKITQEALSRFLPFYQCQFEDCAPEFSLIGLYGAESEAFIQDYFAQVPDKGQVITTDQVRVYQIAPQLYECWLKHKAPEFSEALADSNLLKKSLIQWQQANVLKGQASVTRGSSGEYTPEELNFDLAGHVSFEKGCYTGQEIVARMHYKGKARKRLYPFISTTDITLNTNEKFKYRPEKGSEKSHTGQLVQYIPEYKTGLAILDTSVIGKNKFLTLENPLTAKLELVSTD